MTVTTVRKCRKSRCSVRACATLTYDYDDSTVVIGPLSSHETARGFDLCANHVNSFTAPQGWQVVRLANNFLDLEPTEEEFESLSEGVREAAMRAKEITRSAHRTVQESSFPGPPPPQPGTDNPGQLSADHHSLGRKRGYFRVVDGEGK